MRVLAAFLSEAGPDVVAISGIGDGDTLAIATRFDWKWAYRGRQALLWNGRFDVGSIDDRRGMLYVAGRVGDIPLTLLATKLSEGRASTYDLRLARAALRDAPAHAIAFVTPAPGRIGFGDLGCVTLTSGEQDADLSIAARGFEFESVRFIEAADRLGAAIVTSAAVR